MSSTMSSGCSSKTTTNKVFLWGAPRTASTVILKCMSHIPGTQAWHQPYFFFGTYGRIDINKSSPIRESYHQLVERAGGKNALDKVEGGFDSSKITSLQWITDTLEGDFPDKTLVVVKELGNALVNRKGLIPTGFKHTFLIRHPYRIALGLLSWHDTFDQSMNDKLKEEWGEGTLLAGLRPMKYLHDIWEYITEKFPENKVAIIDTDDLLENPAEVLERYCKAVDIPYTDSILKWEAGGAICHQWIVAKEWLLINDALGYKIHKSTLASTGFEKRFRKPIPSKDQFPPVWHPILDEEMEYYDKLYSKGSRIYSR